MNDLGAAGYWRAVGMLRLDRPEGLRRLKTCFGSGTVPPPLDGALRGRLITATVGYGVDRPFDAMASLWMPWKGKTFDSLSGQGRNIFVDGVRTTMRFTLPSYHSVTSEGENLCTAFRFEMSVGPSALLPDVDVLRIDYRDVEENPTWPIRQVLDELVAIDAGLYLGQALLHWRGELRRAAWFSLEAA
jgi:hypothetical protein